MAEDEKFTVHCEVHPDRPAATSCDLPSCSKPICADCQTTTDDGTFCSVQCASIYHDLFAHDGKRKRVSAAEALLPGVYKLIALVCIVFFILLLVSVFFPLPFFSRVLRVFLKWTR